MNKKVKNLIEKFNNLNLPDNQKFQKDDSIFNKNKIRSNVKKIAQNFENIDLNQDLKKQDSFFESQLEQIDNIEKINEFLKDNKISSLIFKIYAIEVNNDNDKVKFLYGKDKVEKNSKNFNRIPIFDENFLKITYKNLEDNIDKSQKMNFEIKNEIKNLFEKIIVKNNLLKNDLNKTINLIDEINQRKNVSNIIKIDNAEIMRNTRENQK
jgi:hypothetical protein